MVSDEVVEATMVLEETEETVVVTGTEDAEFHRITTLEPDFQLEVNDFDGDIEPKFVEPRELVSEVVSPYSSGWYIQKVYPSLFSKNRTLAKGCGKGTFQGSYGYPINKCLKYYGTSTNDFLKAQRYQCNSTYMTKYVYRDTACSDLWYTNTSKIHCTQKCSSFGGYPYYNNTAYRLQVGQESTTGCRGDKTYYYIEIANVCQYRSYNQSYRIVYPNEYDYNNYNCNGFGPARLAQTSFVPSGNLTYGCLVRPYDRSSANNFPTAKYVSYVYPGIVVSNATTTPPKQYKVHSQYPGNLTYAQILGWSLAITICFTLCCCLCIAYCIMTYCPWCLTCCLGEREVKEKRVVFHGTVHYRSTTEKYVEKPFDPTVTEPSRPIEQRYANGVDGEYIEGDDEVVDEEEDDDARPVGRDTTGINLINQFAYEDEPPPDNRYSNRRSNYSMNDGYSYDYPQYEMQTRYPSYSQQYQQQQYYGDQYSVSEYNDGYGGYRHQSATFDAYV